MGNVGILYDRLEYFNAIWYIFSIWFSLWSFGTFSRFGMFEPRKIWQPWTRLVNPWHYVPMSTS
jgi:hypothetical protein